MVGIGRVVEVPVVVVVGCGYVCIAITQFGGKRFGYLLRRARWEKGGMESMDEST
jgi:hypothetical protein